MARAVQSLRLDVGCPDHLGPLLDFVGNELAEVGRRARKHRATQVGKPRLYFEVGEPGVDLSVELVNNFGGCVLRRADAEANARLVAGDKVAYASLTQVLKRKSRLAKRGGLGVESIDRR